MDINQLVLLINELSGRVTRMEGSLSVLNTLVIVLLPTIVAGVATIIWRTAAMEGKIEKVLREHEAKAN